MWLVAVLPIACATLQPAQPARHDPAPQPVATHPEPDAMFGIARVASLFDIQLTPELVDRMVRWQLAMRDAVHAFGDRLAALIDEAGIAPPDLTVLSIEPVAHTESSGFGWRDDPIRHTRSFHSGTDFRGDPGTPVVAAGDGVVHFCGRLGGYGNVIDIDHGGGVLTRYAHLRRILTAKDAAITAGVIIGQLGSTGRTTGPHLHFEVRLDGAPVSPIAALTVATLQRESPLLGRLAALSLSPELQSTAESEVDPPKQRAKPSQRPERPGRGKRRQVLW
jgi:murein DD-endopeptidase MepM/ murein hydrolase activator NlpD